MRSTGLIHLLTPSSLRRAQLHKTRFSQQNILLKRNYVTNGANEPDKPTPNPKNQEMNFISEFIKTTFNVSEAGMRNVNYGLGFVGILVTAVPTILTLKKYYDSRKIQEYARMRRLTLASMEGNMKVVEEILSDKTNDSINAQDIQRNTALHYAASRGNHDLVRRLLYAGANPLKENSNGLTPFHEACFSGNAETVSILSHQSLIRYGWFTKFRSFLANKLYKNSKLMQLELIRKIDPVLATRRTKKNWTPLMFACFNGHNETAKRLLNMEPEIVENFIDVSSKDDGDTALHMAVRNNDTETVELLIRKKANVGIRNKAGYTSLHLAAYYGHTEIGKMLLEKDPSLINAKGGRFDRTPVLEAISNAKIEFIEAVLEGKKYQVNLLLETNHNRNCFDVCNSLSKAENKRYPNLNQTYEKIQKTLEKYLKGKTENVKSSIDIAREKLEHIDFSSLNNKVTRFALVKGKNNKYLHYAAVANNERILKKLLNNLSAFGIDIDGGNDINSTALHEAALFGNIEAVRLLLENGANPNTKNKFSWTPLMSAVWSDHYEIVFLLLKHKANTEYENNSGENALYLAVDNRNLAMVDILLNSISDKNTKLSNINIRDKMGYSLLHLAVINNDLPMVKKLIENGIDLNFKRKPLGFTPLHEAVIRDNYEIIKYLVEKGADVLVRTLEDKEAIDFAKNDKIRILLWDEMQQRSKSVSVINKHDINQKIDEFNQYSSKIKDIFNRHKNFEYNNLIYPVTRISLYTREELSIERRKGIDEKLKTFIENLEESESSFETIRAGIYLTGRNLDKCKHVLKKIKYEKNLLNIAHYINLSILSYQLNEFNESNNFINLAFKELRNIFEVDMGALFKEIESNDHDEKTYYNNLLKLAVSAYNMQGLIKRALSNFVSCKLDGNKCGVSSESWNCICDKELELNGSYFAFQMAVKIDGNHPYVYHNLGWLLVEEFGDTDAGLECHKNAFKLKPFDANVATGLAVALQHSGNLLEASDFYVSPVGWENTLAFRRTLQ